MTTKDLQTLEQLLRQNKLDWLIDMYAPPTSAMTAHFDKLKELVHYYGSRFGTTDELSPDNLRAEYDRNPQKIRAFLQAFSVCRSLEMLSMVWRVLSGDIVQSVELKFQKSRRFLLKIRLKEPNSGEFQDFVSTNIDDTILLRHFVPMYVDDRPQYMGIYPVRNA